MTDTTTRHRGTVKWFGSDGRHFGFLRPDDGSDDVFVHISAVQSAGLRCLEPDQRVEFSIIADPKNGRPKACDLKLI
jgi:CspA family cold shock protein